MNMGSLRLLFILLLVDSPALSQKFSNLDFKDLCDSSETGICHWNISWGSQQNIKPEIKNNHPAVLIKGHSGNDVGFIEQSVSFTPFKQTTIVTLFGVICTENVEGKGAGLNLNIYGNDESFLGYKDMGGFYSVDWIKGSRNWQTYKISLVCPAGTKKIKIGAILYGKGKAWFRDYKVSYINVEGRKHSALAEKLISQALDTIKTHSLYRDSVDIQKLKQTALQIAGNAKSYAECYLAIDYLLGSLREYGDHHSFFMKANEVKNWETGSTENNIEFPSFKIVDECGYIKVPAFHSGNKKTISAYADSLQLIIKSLDNINIKGWIIDLRENTGGNMEPMIAGLGPLFTGKKLGALVDVNKKENAWYYDNGRYFWDDDQGFTVKNHVVLKSKRPVAVLTSRQVGSSGEIVVISFIGNEKTRSFGQGTMGLTTGNGSFSLVDGSKIFLASTIMADRNNKLYKGSIPPDVSIDKMYVDKKDKVLEEAIEWINGKQ